MQMGIQNKTCTKQYGELQDHVMHKRFPSSARSRLYGIIFTNSKYVNHLNITTHNITHGRSRMNMLDVQHRSIISKCWVRDINVLGMAGLDERTLIHHRRRRKCIKFVRSMYGNVDAALRRQKAFIKLCTNDESKCIQSKTDPCMLYKRNQKGKICLMIAL